MATRRTTFSKTQRERDKRAKAAAKRERRTLRAEEAATDTGPARPVDENRVMAELGALHERYDRGELSLDEFVERREELLAHLVIG